MTSFEQKCRYVTEDGGICINNTEMTEFRIGSLRYCRNHRALHTISESKDGTTYQKIIQDTLSIPKDVSEIIINYDIINELQYEFNIKKYNMFYDFIFVVIDNYVITEYKFDSNTTSLIMFDYKTYICENILIENIPEGYLAGVSSEELTAISTIGNFHIIFGCLDGTIKIWNLQSRTWTHRIKEHDNIIKKILPLSETKFATFSEDDRMTIFDLELNSVIKRYTNIPINNVIVMGDKIITSIHTDADMKIWNIDDTTDFLPVCPDYGVNSGEQYDKIMSKEESKEDSKQQYQYILSGETSRYSGIKHMILDSNNNIITALKDGRIKIYKNNKAQSESIVTIPPLSLDNEISYLTVQDSKILVGYEQGDIIILSHNTKRVLEKQNGQITTLNILCGHRFISSSLRENGVRIWYNINESDTTETDNSKFKNIFIKLDNDDNYRVLNVISHKLGGIFFCSENKLKFWI